ncbi:MAG: mechanosensitive ion channel family protein [Patescibacteria group bacterium]|nr:mechanosensitive ion channel family protein [Patescibacteria group bacterium]
MNLDVFFEFNLWNNTEEQYFWALIVFVGLMIIFKIFTVVINVKLRKASEKTKTNIDDFLIELIKHVKPPFYFFISLYIAVQFLSLNEVVGKIIFGTFVIVLVIQVIAVTQKVIDYIIKKKLVESDGSEENKDRDAIIRLSGQLTKAALWIFGGLLVLSNLGVNITSLIAGLGIGGIAIALAAQSVLGDVFASIAIFIDKPFKVGEFIALTPEEQGTVEKIGIKTTKLRTKQGQQLIIANKKLTDATISNYRRMESRQTTFMIGVTYETSLKKLKRIPKLIKDIIKEQKHAELVRVFFKEYGDFSLNYEIVFKMKDPSFEKSVKAKHAINLKIFEVFQEEGIEFAYPTQTLIIQKSQQSTPPEKN